MNRARIVLGTRQRLWCGEDVAQDSPLEDEDDTDDDD